MELGYFIRGGYSGSTLPGSSLGVLNFVNLLGINGEMYDPRTPLAINFLEEVTLDGISILKADHVLRWQALINSKDTGFLSTITPYTETGLLPYRLELNQSMTRNDSLQIAVRDIAPQMGSTVGVMEIDVHYSLKGYAPCEHCNGTGIGLGWDGLQAVDIHGGCTHCNGSGRKG